ncbi:MAG: protease inhibitor I42 family protein [Actinobacteria bacterium]|nr:protease inhibitor I42 family protein [Actinomycetota bacterium]
MSDCRIGPQDAGRDIEVAAGDRLLVVLPENAGTGYTWEVENVPPGARVIEEYYEHGEGTGIGGASTHVFVLQPPAEQGALRLRHGQPWMGEAGISERYEVTLVPQGA